jgi:hypothetical protein
VLDVVDSEGSVFAAATIATTFLQSTRDGLKEGSLPKLRIPNSNMWGKVRFVGQT